MTPRTFVRFFSSCFSSFGVLADSAALVSASFTSSFVISNRRVADVFVDFLSIDAFLVLLEAKDTRECTQRERNDRFHVNIVSSLSSFCACTWCFRGVNNGVFCSNFPSKQQTINKEDEARALDER